MRCLVSLLSLGFAQAFQPSFLYKRYRGTPTFGPENGTPTSHGYLQAFGKAQSERRSKTNMQPSQLIDFNVLVKPLSSALVALFLSFNAAVPTLVLPASAADNSNIAACLFQKCPVPLLKCIANPKCLANVICINTCVNKEDEIGCQIECGDQWENDVVGQFNKCALSDMSCVPKRQDDGSYPVPPKEATVPKVDTKFFDGRLYITAGQNKLFDVFPCQVHFFTETEPGKFVGKLNWRIEEPDGEFFTRDAVQSFVQDPKQPGHFLNHDNEYLHYQDDWYILDAEYDNNPNGLPPFAFVYYRGSNDAWDGYGGAFLYTRASSFPEELYPRLREASKKVGFDFDKDFELTDNSCKNIDSKEALLLKEKFAGKVVIQTERQLQAEAIKGRTMAVDTVKKDAVLVEKEVKQIEKAIIKIEKKTAEFEKEVVRDVVNVEKEVINDAVKIEKEIVKDVVKVEKTIVKDVVEAEKEIVNDAIKVKTEIKGLIKK